MEEGLGPDTLGNRSLGALRQESHGAEAPQPCTHRKPALALVCAVVHLGLAQGDGVDDPVDQLLANLLRGALQRQCPATRQGVRGLAGPRCRGIPPHTEQRPHRPPDGD